MIELNYNLENIVYFCEQDNVWKTEVFKDIPGYEKLYQVSDLGRIKSLYRLLPFKNTFRGVKEKILHSPLDNHRYAKVSLFKDAKQFSHKVHQLVAMAFLDHKPDKYSKIVDHKNNIRNDNRLLNLQLISHRENTSKDSKQKSGYVGVRKSNSRFRAEIQVNGNYLHLGTFDTAEEASEAYKNKVNEIRK